MAVIEAFQSAHPSGYIAVVSDHGEAFGDGGPDRQHYAHNFLVPGTLRVPLILSGPDVPSDHTVDAPVQNFDLFPTVLQWADVTPTPQPATFCDGFQSQSLLPLLEAPAAAERLRFAERYPSYHLTADYRDPTYSCVWLSAEESGLLVTWPTSDVPDGACSTLSPMAFEMEPVRDQYEDIFDPESQRQMDLLARGKQCLAVQPESAHKTLEGVRSTLNPEEMDEETRKALEALGYL